MSQLRLFLLIGIAIIVGAFFYLDLQQLLTLDSLKSQHENILHYRNSHPVFAAVIFGLIYIAVTGLSLPGATLLTLAGGAVFGFLWGSLIISFASSIGATLAFLAARFLFRDLVNAKFTHQLKEIEVGFAKDGAFYLFSLRLVPLIPFFVINLLMGLTSIKAWTFYWVSQLGMFAGTLVYVNAGTQLNRIDSLSNILSPVLVGSFALLGIFPLITKKLVEYFLGNK